MDTNLSIEFSEITFLGRVLSHFWHAGPVYWGCNKRQLSELSQNFIPIYKYAKQTGEIP